MILISPTRRSRRSNAAIAKESQNVPPPITRLTPRFSISFCASLAERSSLGLAPCLRLARSGMVASHEHHLRPPGCCARRAPVSWTVGADHLGRGLPPRLVRGGRDCAEQAPTGTRGSAQLHL